MHAKLAPRASEAGYLDLERFSATPLESDPFDFLIVENFVRAGALCEVNAGFPEIARGGSFPVGSLDCGPGVLRLVEELRGAAVTRAFAEKFGLDLAGRPTMVTLRGRSRRKDGRIHTDSASKLITALVYLNEAWEPEGGRLRLLRGGGDLDDYAAEVTPVGGALLAFRCGDTAWHGHKPFEGARRSIQLNWVTDAGVVRREVSRHAFSAWTKRLLGLGRGGH